MRFIIFGNAELPSLLTLTTSSPGLYLRRRHLHVIHYNQQWRSIYPSLPDLTRSPKYPCRSFLARQNVFYLGGRRVPSKKTPLNTFFPCYFRHAPTKIISPPPPLFFIWENQLFFCYFFNLAISFWRKSVPQKHLRQARHTTKALIMLPASDTPSIGRVCCLSLELIPAKTKQVTMGSVLYT